MRITEYYNNKIHGLKKQLIETYLFILVIFHIFSIYIYLFWLKNTFPIYYFAAALLFYIYSYVLIRRNFDISRVVNAYLHFSSLHISVIILNFIDDSLVGFIWLIPMPVCAYVFLKRKTVVYFMFYTVFLMIFIMIYSKYFNHHFYEYDKKYLRPTNAATLLANVSLICLFIFYKLKISRLEDKAFEYNIKSRLRNRYQFRSGSSLKENENAYSLPNKNKNELIIDYQKLESLFLELDKYIKNNNYFTNPSIKVSSLCSDLKTNVNYLSRAVDHKGYKNFNQYINSLRIMYVKNLLETSDLSKVTLMYIYTGAGFTSQATFNRVFKQFEGTTPSEYITNLLHNKSGLAPDR
ncbi:AraC-like DNA-binding protein [Chryseobacterium sp. H1D6B]|uniref:helix-turn-helix domain-containing protein n=1 Tax=Chryseobacterium sp. H1D6B TaxID=2940588 RepID=UPI0015C9CDE8|nr:AraC family transcriptional regulator [Chryseobacterium sp. H1D6B]MDH6251996.1 AraC-like DNA-binding protein [Chryseobacterium sp. H1D6B]